MSTILEAGTAIYIALAVALAVWIGIFVYLWRIDAQARELRRRRPREARGVRARLRGAQREGLT